MTKHRVTRRLLAVALSVLLVLGCVAPAVAATYESGTYTGTGTGRNGSVALTLTLTNGAIASVDNVTHSETARYWEKAKVLLDRLVGLQTPEQVEKLDAVTGATLSSNAIKEAAKDVFRQAESKETPVFASGSGTKSDPYLIRTAAQLQAFAAAVNGGTGYEGQYISLDADLDLTGTAWTPIGATGLFNGSFNGNYHTITGMTIGSESEKASYTEAGLFGSVGKGAAIRNVGVINAAIYNKTTTDPSVGLLAAGISENSIVESCWATGTIYSDTTSPYYSYVGGLVGSIGIKSLICNSWTNVVVYAKGSSDSFVGGIVGDTGNNSAVVNCAALGSVANYGNTSMMYGAGGVVGYSSGAVYASYSSSRIHMDAVSYDDGADVPVGGVVGSPSALSAAYNCYFNKEEKQTYYDGEVSTPLAVGYDVLNYSESDNDHCEGLTAAEIASETLLNKLTAALTPGGAGKGPGLLQVRIPADRRHHARQPAEHDGKRLVHMGAQCGRRAAAHGGRLRHTGRAGLLRRRRRLGRRSLSDRDGSAAARLCRGHAGREARDDERLLRPDGRHRPERRVDAGPQLRRHVRRR